MPVSPDIERVARALAGKHYAVRLSALSKLELLQKCVDENWRSWIVEARTGRIVET